MVAMKYAPLAVACLSLCTGVSASVISKRQLNGDVAGVDLGSLGALASSPPSSSGERAVSNRAEADPIPAALNLGGAATVPGSNQNTAVVALTPGAKAAYDPVNGLTLTQLDTISTLVPLLASTLLSLVSLTASSLPAPASGATGALSGPLAQGTAVIGRVLPLLGGTLPTDAAVPPNVTDTLGPLVGLLGPLLGSTPIPPSDPVGSVTGLVALLTALLPVLTGLAGGLSAQGL